MRTTTTVVPKYDKEKHTLLLEMDRAFIDLEKVRARALRENFTERKEFYITILGNRAGTIIGRALSHHLGKGNLKEKEKALEMLTQETIWTKDMRIVDRHYMLHKDDPVDNAGTECRESFIQEIEMPAAVEFIEKVNQMFAIDLKEPFPHVTLFTKGDGPNANLGIGIMSRQEFETIEHVLV